MKTRKSSRERRTDSTQFYLEESLVHEFDHSQAGLQPRDYLVFHALLAHLLDRQAPHLTTRMPVPREIACWFELVFTD